VKICSRFEKFAFEKMQKMPCIVVKEILNHT